MSRPQLPVCFGFTIGIVKSLADAPSLEDLLGPVNIIGSKQQESGGWTAPHFGDFINTLTEYLALPLGEDSAKSLGAIPTGITCC